MREVKFIDLFAGIGGLRLGFEEAFKKAGFDTKCVMTSEIKAHALNVLHHNFSHDYFVGDITKVKNHEIPDFDFLLGGFPCQPFSAGGKRQGFVDTRGTLFFEIERILENKKPYGFILENVEGLVKHDLENKGDEFGRTLNVIISKLRGLGYKVTTKVLNSADFGLPQARKRIFIVGTLDEHVDLNHFDTKRSTISSILETGLPTIDSKFIKLLLKHFSLSDLYGKSIKDKRGGDNNIHSWDIELKGPVTKEQAGLLNRLFKERRKKHWAKEIGIDWMDGMPLTLNQIKTFYDKPNLEEMLDDLVSKKYLKFEHPKSLVTEQTLLGVKTYRLENKRLSPGYNIVSGKLSYEVNKILDPNGIAPTLVATDMARLVVPDGTGLRSMTLREGLRLFGFPEWFQMPVSPEDGFDLLGNTVAVNVVTAVAEKITPFFVPSQVEQSEQIAC
ncbi:DNA (cytosine-5)-methyltransferase 1 [Mucilaginibacter sp. SG538B]|uniref:DNA (cytosine-5-)-methyltransferase n=1 Tax=Mucilaginibacter sp. SG538B TaxID=2587021 RepID=UPI00159DA9C4|nr:DNA (cytosine-5-)-methyltransferase [Mucilaginibacter sp. SG538B]NVM64784.1 DNA (cytosine-5)-methyltransferase 1 [Mucilaginibacter sp. SG538B]